MRTALIVLACGLWCATAAHTQSRSASDPVDAVVRRLERVLTSGDKAAFPALFDASVSEDKVTQHSFDLFFPNAVRIAVFERNRSPLEGVPAGDGFRVVVEFFMETKGQARIVTAGLDIKRPPGGDAESWRISGIDEISAIDGLYKLRLNTTTPQSVRNLELRAEDAIIAMQDGLLFRVECDQGVTGIVLVGRGELRFSPAPATERGQLRIFSGADSLNAAFETAYIRLQPLEYTNQMATATLTDAAADPAAARRAQDVFRRESSRSFGVDVSDMSKDTWHLLPNGDDFLAEVDTRRFDTLTYLRANQQAEDVSLFRRSDRKTITLYSSVAKLAARGRFYSDDASREYDVLDYAVTAGIDPQRQLIRGRARLSIRVRSTALPTMYVRLADSLAVSSVSSVEYGRLLHLRLDGQNMIAVNMPHTLLQDSDLTLIVEYAGRVESQSLDIDTVRADSIPESVVTPESKYLLSNRSYWYPQNPIGDYATASLRLTVPNDYRVVASGEPVADAGTLPPTDGATVQSGNTFAFRANQPLRYLAFVASRMSKVAERKIEVSRETAGAGGDSIAMTIEANPRLQSRGRNYQQPTEDILRFYTSLVGDAPYASATVALTESELPGGHSPAYFALMNEPAQLGITTWRNDPAAFDGFPEFFLAHELAHQWWGQAVGWKNYHEQWLSEGFAQYFAAMYAQKTRGDRVFVDMLGKFRRFAMEQSPQGPVYLGYRLGHLKSDLKIFRALVYNKGASVLHMLRRLLGDETFFRGVRLFYEDQRFQKAGTDDLERAMETASGRVLDRFFDRWIYNAELPRVSFRSTIADGRVTVEFEQIGNAIFDIPVTVRLVMANGQTRDVMVPVTDKQLTRAIPTDMPVREVQVNRDFAALAEFEQR
jgi:peptidase M1-like protein